MKNNIFKHLFLAVTLILGLASCDDREIVTIDNVSSPIVMDLSSSSLVLDKNFPGNPALTVTWQSAVYSVPTEISYRIEIANENTFKEPYTLATVTGSERAAAFTNLQMNDAAAAIGLAPNVSTKMFIRVISYLGSGQSLAETSNVTSLMITPYVLTYPSFYIVGSASYVGWTPEKAQILYKKDNLSYIYTNLQSGENFRFLGQLAWDGKNYALNTAGTKASNQYFNQWSDVFTKPDGDDENIKFIGATGVYKITINATLGVQTIEAKPSVIPTYDFPEIYLVGNIAGNGWSPENGVAMTTVGDGVYEFTSTLAGDTEFKIIGQKSWGSLDWGNISEDGNTGFVGPKGDNGNIKFAGDGSSYKITVNLKAGIYTIIKL
ncbi:SusF/SusE family outer membrane protein [Kaistella flava (ex Peng et al. 2021)]|uniref:SusF/SusE family outer membrane protein n=1 Tax=Kaistella flava (ex Peng et al. 2021) TaxID=2038776 RepID=A0A7M2Y4S1_9FLAO|nr:SusE domain-containing protein [Kaistella flava (ex Peng et al. 2021)]QOW08849.1 SusF/SusE family outer membrane protein [Kaistella flava (ex Peng et al. 2021)]